MSNPSANTPPRSAAETARLVADGELSAVEAVRTAIDAIERLDGPVRAFLGTRPEHALAEAQRLDAARASGAPLGPLAGVPVALKDNICLAHGRTTCASRMLEHYESPFTATAAQRLIDAGAIIVGKTNLDEFAMGSSCEHSAFGPTRNPWDHARVPGGSSGGSAAAVAAGMVPIALGSDTGGSIRQPAGLCGVVGLKPTYGRVSRLGLVAFASSLDQIGPLTRTVEDAALALRVMAGHDPLDNTSSARAPEPFDADLDAAQSSSARPLRLAVPRQARSDAVHPEVARVFAETEALLRDAGVELIDADLPHTDFGIAAYYLVATAEASSNLARFDGVRYGHRARLAPGEGLDELYARSRAEGFGPEVQRRILLGTHVLSSGYYDAYYTTALKARRLIQQDHEALFRAGADAILLPASPSPAFKLGEKSADPLALYLEDVFTVGVNLAGLPAVTVPAGFAAVDNQQLPVGVQLIGRAWGERALLRAARLLERSVGLANTVAPS